MQARLSEFYLSSEKNAGSIFAVVNIGATGAPTLQKYTQPLSGAGAYAAAGATGFHQMLSVVRNSAGNYTFTIGAVQGNGQATASKVTRLLGVASTFDMTGISVGASTAAPAAPIMWIQNNTIASNGALKLVFSAAAGGAGTELDNGTVLIVEIKFTLSSAP